MSRAGLSLQLLVDGLLAAVIGSHAEAEGRVRLLSELGAKLRVFAAAPTAALRAACEECGAVLLERTPLEADFAGVRVAFYVDRDREEARRLLDWARRAGTLFCSTDLPEACDFYMPAIVRRGDLVVAVGTGGASPALAARLRAEIERLLDPSVAEFVRSLERLREELRDRPEAERHALLRQAVKDVHLRGVLELPGKPT